MHTYLDKIKLKRNNKFREELRKKPTEPELIVKNWLEKNGIKFIFQKGFIKPFHRIVDFYIPKKHLIIEIDGEYHKNKEIKLKDYNKDKIFKTFRNFDTVRVTNEEVFNEEYKSKILTSLGGNYILLINRI